MTAQPPAQGRGWSLGQIVLLLVGLALGAPCFCCGGLLLFAPEPEPYAVPAPPSTPAEDVVPLGRALVPPDQQEPVISEYQWRAPPLKPERYGADYGLEVQLSEDLAEELEAMGRRMRFRRIGDERIAFDAPPACQRDLRCVYRELGRRHAPLVAPLASLFLERGRAAGLSSQELAVLILTFVQHLRYDLPERPFGLLPPALVAYEGWGDCDSKALLAVLLLRACGIGAAVLGSQKLAHAAVGVRLPGAGTAFERRGARYLYTEVTAEGWPIGTIPPKYDQPRTWEVLWVAE